MKTSILNTHLLSILICLLITPNVSYSESAKKMDLKDLVDLSDRIVVGKCVSVHSEWSGGKIFSQNTIEVTDNIKGDAISTYVVTTLGGKAYHPKLKAEVLMDVSGGLTFQPSEDVILFTKQNRLGQNQVVGMSEGKFNIVTDKISGERSIPLTDKKIHSEKLVKDILKPSVREKIPGQEATVIKSEEIKLDKFIEKIKSKMDKK